MVSPASNTLAFATNSTERLRIDSSGNVGIGTTSPSQILELKASEPRLCLNGTTANSDKGIEFEHNGTRTGHLFHNYNSGETSLSSGDSGSSYFITFKTDNSERMRIDSSGNLGIGQTSPAAKLDVNGNYTSNVTAVSALAIDCSAGNYFTKTINANSTFTFTNVPSSRSYAFTLELTHTSGTVTWPSSVKFPATQTPPSLTAGKTHLFVFETNDGGTRFRGAVLADYDN